MRLPPTMKGTNFFPFFWFLQVVRLLVFFWPSLFVSFFMVLVINLLLDFCVELIFYFLVKTNCTPELANLCMTNLNL